MNGPRERPRSLGAAMIATYGTNLTVAALGLLNVLVVARTLGPSGRGSVAFLTTLAYLTSQLVTLGVQQSCSNFAAREPGLTRTLSANSLILSIVTGAAGVAIVAGLIAVFPAVGGHSEPALQWLALASVPVLVFQTYAQSLVTAHYGYAINNVAWLVTPVVNITVNGTLALAGVLTVGIAVGSWVGGQVLGCLLLGWYVVRRLGGFGRPDLRLVKRMVGFGVQAHITRIFSLGNYRLDQWMMGAIAGARELGYYSVAVAWAEALFFLPTTLAQVQRPDLSRATTREEAARQVGPVFRASMWITLASTIVMVLIAPVLCTTIFGAEFGPSVHQLRILALGAFGIVALKLLGNTLVAQGRPLFETAAVLVAFAVIVGLDIALIPGLNGLGAAIGSTVSYTLGGVAIVFAFCRGLHVSPRELLPRWGDVGELIGKFRAMLRRPRVAS